MISKHKVRTGMKSKGTQKTSLRSASENPTATGWHGRKIGGSPIWLCVPTFRSVYRYSIVREDGEGFSSFFRNCAPRREKKALFFRRICNSAPCHNILWKVKSPSRKNLTPQRIKNRFLRSDNSIIIDNYVFVNSFLKINRRICNFKNFS